MPNHTHIMRDKQQRYTRRALQVAKQVEHLGLNGHVKRRDRLVAYHKARLANKRPCQIESLTLSPRKVMRIAVIMLCQKTDRGQGRERAPMALIRIAHAGDNQRGSSKMRPTRLRGSKAVELSWNTSWISRRNGLRSRSDIVARSCPR